VDWRRRDVHRGRRVRADNLAEVARARATTNERRHRTGCRYHGGSNTEIDLPPCTGLTRD
jgi:hypothetical protein